MARRVIAGSAMARFGRHGKGKVRSWLGLAGHGMSVFGRHGTVRKGKARCGTARQGTVRQARLGGEGHGKASQGMDWQGVAGEVCLGGFRQVRAMSGNARHGKAQLGWCGQQSTTKEVRE